MPKPFSVRVITVESELEFAIQATTTVKQLFEQVARTLSLREVWFFGLQFVDSKNLTAWARMHKKIVSEDFPKDAPFEFRFAVRYFPEDAAEEIIWDVTTRLLYLQVRDSILREEIYCPAETAVLLSSFAVQAKYGDFRPEFHKPGYLSSENLLPKRVFEQYRLSREQWEERISAWHVDRAALTREEAMMEYLKIAEELDQYGVTYFEIMNKKGTRLYLGIDAAGLNIYDFDNKLTPRSTFPWSEIRNVHFNNQTFTITPMDRKTTKDIVFYSDHLRVNKRILELCMGNHELFIRRRNPDPLEIQQMKAQAREERLHRQKEHAFFVRERVARQTADKKRQELEERVRRFEDEAKQAMAALSRSEQQAAALEAKVKQAQLESAALEQLWHNAEDARREAEESARRYHAANAASAEERSALLAATQQAERKARDLQAAVEAREAETLRVSKELAAARVKQAEDARLALAATTLSQQQQHDLAAPEGETDADGDVDDSIANYKAATGNEHLLAGVRAHVERERIALKEKNKNIKAQLEALAAALDAERDESKMTAADKQHRENVSAGRDKFKTLRAIKAGNTKSRVTAFEDL